MNYELTFLLNEEEELKKIREIIESFSGKIINEEKWGKKTLAYPIKKNHSAYYYSWKIEINQNKIAELKKKLNFSEKLMRYLLLSY